MLRNPLQGDGKQDKSVGTERIHVGGVSSAKDYPFHNKLISVGTDGQIAYEQYRKDDDPELQLIVVGVEYIIIYNVACTE